MRWREALSVRALPVSTTRSGNDGSLKLGSIDRATDAWVINKVIKYRVAGGPRRRELQIVLISGASSGDPVRWLKAVSVNRVTELSWIGRYMCVYYRRYLTQLPVSCPDGCYFIMCDTVRTHLAQCNGPWLLIFLNRGLDLFVANTHRDRCLC
ncbi:hypothetical protein T265_02537 [Opisthorchis viverrini]|uniref:Uncharacterized protein n=1 Tax=Opisthorchis viverrini TaxID=6198 RepID=A0A074ZVU2_OPIVI|nr:hypothetical protein T265_02537 [Opisthorchis viverrini]KER31221.1 hypothetical protein T265_02537 [Opisthorchis viverrini]